MRFIAALGYRMYSSVRFSSFLLYSTHFSQAPLLLSSWVEFNKNSMYSLHHFFSHLPWKRMLTICSYSAVTGVFREDSTNFRAPPFQMLNEDGTLAYIVKGPEASPLYVPGEVPDQYPILRLVEDFPKLNTSEPIALQSKPFEPDSEAPM